MLLFLEFLLEPNKPAFAEIVAKVAKNAANKAILAVVPPVLCKQHSLFLEFVRLLRNILSDILPPNGHSFFVLSAFLLFLLILADIGYN